MARRLRPTAARPSLARVGGIAATAVLLASLQACGAGNKSAAPEPTPTAAVDVAAPAPSGPTVERNAFPAYVKHTWGTTVVESEPKRIVALGLRDHEMLLALGVTPIAIRNAFGADHPYADWPWVPDSVREGQYEYLKAGLQDSKTGKIAPPVDGPIDAGDAPMAATTPSMHQVFDWEHIASLKPDLIVGTFSGTTKEDYDKLVKIAPTITGVSADGRSYYSSWQEEMLALGKAVGRPNAAANLIADTEAPFNSLRESHPEFKDATVALVAPAGNGKIRVINPFAPMARFFTALRMRFPSVVDSLMNTPGLKATYGVEIDAGSLPLLSNVDALVWIVGAEGSPQLDKIKSNGWYQSMRVVQRGGAIYMGGNVSEAVYFSSPFSLPWALERLKPQLIKALEPKAAKEAAIDAAAERSAERAENNGDFIFQYGDETAPPKPFGAPGDDDNNGNGNGPTASPTTGATPDPAETPEP